MFGSSKWRKEEEIYVHKCAKAIGSIVLCEQNFEFAILPRFFGGFLFVIFIDGGC